MKIYKNFELNEEIQTMDEWLRKCPPKRKELHWEDGRSAKELARYMTGNLPNIPEGLRAILSKYSSVEDVTVAPEYVTNLKTKGFGSGEGRNHDALIVTPEAVFGVEAKADEDLSKYYSKINIYDTPNHMARYLEMYKALFDDPIDGMVRYQLVSASIGTILEAIQRKKGIAILLIITFLKEHHYKERKVTKNLDDIGYFISKFKKNKDGALQARIAIDNNIRFYVRHIEIKI
ncbi:MAG: hypothetical protein PHT30_01510 [Bacilli bacterium]|nr:hypothetical protein [Bacilli bacterium]